MYAEPLIGAWARSGLVIGGTRVAERCDVLWLQTAETFADIRIPRQPAATVTTGHGPAELFYRPRAFGGVARWNDPVMVWDHLLDSDQQPATDAGTLDLATAGWAYEDGTVVYDGVEVPFREEWELLSAPGDPVRATVAAQRISVTCGAWRIDITEQRPDGPFRAERRAWRDGTWEIVGTVTSP